MSQDIKRIGFVDYKLDNFHANVFLKHLKDETADRGFAAVGGFALDEEDGRAWSENNDVPYFDSVEALNEHVDSYAVLAPSNPELHLELCEMVLPMGKTTYVDKTFAPDLETAEKIFALADEYGVAMQTASALRYTEVQEFVKEAGGSEAVRHMVAWGGGGSFGEYSIHPTEMAISCMGPDVESLMRRGTDEHSQLLLNFSGGRTAVINVYTNATTPFAASITTEGETHYITVDTSCLFVNMTHAMLDLFETGEVSIPREESLMVRRILDSAGKPEAVEGFVGV